MSPNVYTIFAALVLVGFVLAVVGTIIGDQIIRKQLKLALASRSETLSNNAVERDLKRLDEAKQATDRETLEANSRLDNIPIKPSTCDQFDSWSLQHALFEGFVGKKLEEHLHLVRTNFTPSSEAHDSPCKAPFVKPFLPGTSTALMYSVSKTLYGSFRIFLDVSGTINYASHGTFESPKRPRFSIQVWTDNGDDKMVQRDIICEPLSLCDPVSGHTRSVPFSVSNGAIEVRVSPSSSTNIVAEAGDVMRIAPVDFTDARMTAFDAYMLKSDYRVLNQELTEVGLRSSQPLTDEEMGEFAA